jgi:hypothetical protein
MGDECRRRTVWGDQWEAEEGRGRVWGIRRGLKYITYIYIYTYIFGVIKPTKH